MMRQNLFLACMSSSIHWFNPKLKMLQSARVASTTPALQIRQGFLIKPYCRRSQFCTISAAAGQTASSESAAVHDTLLRALEGPSPNASKLLVPLLSASLDLYLRRNRTVVDTAAELCRSKLTGHAGLQHDHYAYRTFGLPGLGIASLAEVLESMGYQLKEDGLAFPKKKLKAAWFAPPAPAMGDVQRLPRVFVSEVEVHRLSKQSQSIIEEYAHSALNTGNVSSSGSSSSSSDNGNSPHAVSASSSDRSEGLGKLGPAQVATAVVTGALPWKTPTKSHWEVLGAESEYAAWVLVHGYGLNHTALATHRMGSTGVALQHVVDTLTSQAFSLNPDGGLIKISPDGLLLQASSLSEQVPFHFSSHPGGKLQEQPTLVPGAYIEYVERRALPNFAHKQVVLEHERREGFEVGNADRLFTSTAGQAGGQQSTPSKG